ncbi:MAG TPA: flagellar hook-basal body complex protein FliE [Nevskia sp.]|nr:flagellar hook-basal body complex protein FliE [Nevskia sp.]
MIYPADPVAAAAASPEIAAAKQAATAPPDFGQWLDQTVSGVSQDVHQADHAVQMLAVGAADNLPEVMIALENARTSLSLMVQVRDRLVGAYQDVLRMQI